MGRNGKSAPVFPAMVDIVNQNVGKIIDSDTILMGNGITRNAATAYLYKFVKLGYLKPINGGQVKSKETKYEVVKRFSEHYNSISLMDELKAINNAEQ